MCRSPLVAVVRGNLHKIEGNVQNKTCWWHPLSSKTAKKKHSGHSMRFYGIYLRHSVMLHIRFSHVNSHLSSISYLLQVAYHSKAGSRIEGYGLEVDEILRVPFLSHCWELIRLFRRSNISDSWADWGQRYSMSTMMMAQRPKGYNSNYNIFQSRTLRDVAIEFPNLKVCWQRISSYVRDIEVIRDFCLLHIRRTRITSESYHRDGICWAAQRKWN